MPTIFTDRHSMKPKDIPITLHGQKKSHGGYYYADTDSKRARQPVEGDLPALHPVQIVLCFTLAVSGIGLLAAVLVSVVHSASVGADPAEGMKIAQGLMICAGTFLTSLLGLLVYNFLRKP